MNASGSRRAKAEFTVVNHFTLQPLKASILNEGHGVHHVHV